MPISTEVGARPTLCLIRLTASAVLPITFRGAQARSKVQTMYQDSDEFEGVSAGWIELGADYFLDAFANGSAYVGAGLSLGNHSIPDGGGDDENAGLQGKASLGDEMFRASTVRLLGQIDATLPLGLGWGSRPN